MRALWLKRSLLGLAILGSGAARAQDCKPLKYLGALPISFTENGFVSVNALLNNTPYPLVLNGGDTNYLTHETTKQLGLVEAPSANTIYMSTGEISNTYVKVPKFSVGPLAGQSMEFRVYGHAPATDDSLSLKTFANYDIDLDFYSKRLNLFSSDHCEGKVTYFSTSALTAIPYVGDDMEIPVMLDGHTTKAKLNIGSLPESGMGLAEATELFGLTAAAANMEPYAKDGVIGYRHVFSSLEFGGVTVRNTPFIIIPEKIKDMFKEKPTGSAIPVSPFRSARIQMTIGQSIMRQLHIYIATKEHKLYIAPGDAAAAKLLPSLNSVSAK